MESNNLPEDFEKKFENFKTTISDDDIQEFDEQRKQFVEKYPLESWPELTLDDYALGLEVKDGVSYDLEYVTTQIGSIKGGSAKKHIVYYSKENDAWIYPEEFDDENDAFESIKQEIINLKDILENGNWEELESVDGLSNRYAIFNKLMFMYFPDFLVPISSKDHLINFSKLINVYNPKKEDVTPIGLNHRIRERFKELFGENIHPYIIMKFLYEEYNPSQSFWKIAPGEKAKYWDECKKNNYICIGWSEMGDMEDYKAKSDFKNDFADTYGYKYDSPQKTGEKANEIWNFAKEVTPGDKIIANKGKSKIVGLGTVTDEGYKYEEDRDEYKHTVSVNWEDIESYEIPKQSSWGFKTVKSLNREEYEHFSNPSNFETEKSLDFFSIFSEIKGELNRKNQIILYGPPGTGKTFIAKKFAEWWLNEKGFESNPNDKNLSLDNNAWWVTTDPSEWKWNNLFSSNTPSTEEFKMGRIKNNYYALEKGDLIFGYASTPEKKIKALAMVDKPLHTNSDGEKVFTLKGVKELDTPIPYKDFKGKEIYKNSEPGIYNNRGTLFKLEKNEKEWILSLCEDNNPEVIDHIKMEEETKRLRFTTFHPSFSYEDFIEGYKPERGVKGTLSYSLEEGIFKKICKEASSSEGPFILIIDEINRANMPKVFGELITLLEKDKRGTELTLPQSKENFHVPDNLYIIATMNTADRSIRTLDAAIRRRFAFIEVMPDDTLLSESPIEGTSLSLREVFDKLNKRIKHAVERNKQIGHSYFMQNESSIETVKEIMNVWKNDIIPLIQEYTFDDPNTMEEILGSDFINSEDMEILDTPFENKDNFTQALQETFGESEIDEE